MHNMIEAWFDGCCEPTNPGGHAAYGVMAKLNGEVVLAEGKYIGHGRHISNNVAEYCGAIRVLEEIAKHRGVALVRGDSKLVINQLNGIWGIRNHGGLYVPYLETARMILKPLKSRVAFAHIYREDNEECDKLSKQVLIDRGIEFRIQPHAA